MKSPSLTLFVLSSAATMMNMGMMGSSDAFMLSPNQPRSFQSSSSSSSYLSYSSGTTALPLPSSDSIFGTNRPRDWSHGDETTTRQRVKVVAPPGRPAHIQEVMTMEEYNKVVAEEKDQVVIVRFYAPWCRVSHFFSFYDVTVEYSVGHLYSHNHHHHHYE